MEYTVINYLFDKGETVSEGICFTSQSKVTGLYVYLLSWKNAMFSHKKSIRANALNFVQMFSVCQ